MIRPLRVYLSVELQEESYTSQASFLDLDPIPVYKLGDDTKCTFSGKRVKCGLYRGKDGTTINADVQGSYNILRKRRPDAFAKGVAGYIVHPVRLAVSTGQINKKRGVPRHPRFLELYFELDSDCRIEEAN